MTCLDTIKNALLSVSQNVSHYSAVKKCPPYIVWEEDGQGEDLWADGKMIGQVLTGTIDLFTANLNDEPLFGAIQNALSGANISWQLNSIQYEERSKWLHYEWTWEVVNCG
ncbi:MAG: hypothetical protein RSG55_08380 [Oscillospiraceae bacterium]